MTIRPITAQILLQKMVLHKEYTLTPEVSYCPVRQPVLLYHRMASRTLGARSMQQAPSIAHMSILLFCAHCTQNKHTVLADAMPTRSGLTAANPSVQDLVRFLPAAADDLLMIDSCRLPPVALVESFETECVGLQLAQPRRLYLHLEQPAAAHFYA
jgi:hypothetical protein